MRHLGGPHARQGYMNLFQIPLPDDVQIFACGPLLVMRLVRFTLADLGVPPSRIRYQVMGPDLWAARIPG